MSGTQAKERAALEAVLAADKEEKNRALIWSLLGRHEKRAAIVAAGMSPAFADRTLDEFTAEQRFCVVAILQNKIQRLEMMAMALGVGVAEAAHRRAAKDTERLSFLEGWATDAHFLPN